MPIRLSNGDKEIVIIDIDCPEISASQEPVNKRRKLGLPRRGLEQVINVNPKAIHNFEQDGDVRAINPTNERCKQWLEQGFQSKAWPAKQATTAAKTKTWLSLGPRVRQRLSGRS